MAIGRPGHDAADDEVAGEASLPPPSAAEAMVEHALAQLPPRDAEVLRLRFGIGGLPRRSAAEVASLLRIPDDRVQQIELAALRMLRLPFRAGVLRLLRPQ